MPGPRKRVTRLDALQLGFSGTVGLSIATILAVTSVQCAQLESDVERQLNDLAGELDQELVAEITSSAKTLDALEAWLGSCPSGPDKSARHPEDYPVNYPEGYPLGSVVEPNCTAIELSASAGSLFRLPELRCRRADRQEAAGRSGRRGPSRRSPRWSRRRSAGTSTRHSATRWPRGCGMPLPPGRSRARARRACFSRWCRTPPVSRAPCWPGRRASAVRCPSRRSRCRCGRSSVR